MLNNPQLEAPLQKGQAVGKINIVDQGKVLKSIPLVVLEPVKQGSLFSRAVDYVKLKI